MTDYYTVQDNTTTKLELGAALGSGGEGSVYSISEPLAWRGYCIKIYNDKYCTASKEDKLRFMIDHPPAPLEVAAGKLCWPVALVYSDESCCDFIGCMMPLALRGSQELYALSNLTNKRLSTDAAWQKYFDQSAASFDHRLKVCINLCSVVDLIHKTDNYAVVDFKPQNIMVTANGAICLVDLDSVQIRADSDGKPHYGRVNTLEYTPPEGANITVKDTLVTQTWDEFSLAVILYQILFGIHPYMATFNSPYDALNSLSQKIGHNLFVHDQGQAHLRSLPPPHQRFDQLPEDIQQLFKRSFDNRTDERTSADQWQHVLTQHLPKSLQRSTPPVLSSVTTPLVSPLRSTLPTLLDWFKQLIVRFNDYHTSPPYSPPTQRLGLRQAPKQGTGAGNNKSNPNRTPPRVNPSAATNRQASKLRRGKTPKRRRSGYQKRQYGNHTPPVHQSSQSLLNKVNTVKSSFASTSTSQASPPSSPLPSQRLARQRSTSPKGIQATPSYAVFRVLRALANHYPTALLLTIVGILFAVFAVSALVTSPSSQVRQLVSMEGDQSFQIRTESESKTDDDSRILLEIAKQQVRQVILEESESRNLRTPTPQSQRERRREQQNILLETLQDPKASKTLKADALYSLNKLELEELIAPRLKLPDDLTDNLPSGQQYPVTVIITITKFGNIERVTIIESSGTRAVDEYAIRSLMTLDFKPIPLPNTSPEGDYHLALTYSH